jgi:hypothetical protein
MGELTDFIARWSRLKRKGADVPEAGHQDAALPGPESPDLPPAVDPDSLPAIESIGPETDIRSFLQPGVPAALRHAALRRAWVADPAIRDAIGLSENAWDFNAPGAIGGFGPLTARDLASLLNLPAQDGATAVSGTTEKASGSQPESVRRISCDAAPVDNNNAPQSAQAQQQATLQDAVQQEAAQHEPTPGGKRRHGSAKPV